MKILVIPDRTKVSKKVWNRYFKRICNRKITEQMKINYDLYNSKI